jgi:hypothetical protein
LVLDKGNAVLKVELALLQALDLKNVGPNRILQGGDRGIQIPVFLLESRELLAKLVLFVLGHRPPLVRASFPAQLIPVCPRKGEYRERKSVCGLNLRGASSAPGTFMHSGGELAAKYRVPLIGVQMLAKIKRL